MANTYVLISSNTLSSSAASVTFSAIPSTYTDLVLRVSARNSVADTIGDFFLRLNGDTSSSNYSDTSLYGTGSASGSARNSNASWSWLGDIDAANNTASTFALSEIYIPNYAGSLNKTASAFTAQEQNGTASRITAVADLWRNTNAITSVSLYSGNFGNFVSGSSFYLYGIKNS